MSRAGLKHTLKNLSYLSNNSRGINVCSLSLDSASRVESTIEKFFMLWSFLLPRRMILRNVSYVSGESQNIQIYSLYQKNIKQFKGAEAHHKNALMNLSTIFFSRQ